MNTPDIYEGVPPTAARPTPPPTKRRPPRLWLHVLLFALTFISATFARTLERADSEGFSDLLLAPLAHPEYLIDGLVFACVLMTILLAHEMGHYLTARRHGVEQSLPYFIPAPTLFGTLGAVILMRSQPRTRSVLLRVAVMGPFAGLGLALPLAAVGLAMSSPVTSFETAESGYWFGSSLLWRALASIFGPDAALLELHPIALAAWVGLFVTSLNLIPAAQLDGGHIAYALFGRAHERMSRLVVALLLVIGIVLGMKDEGVVWLAWGILLLALGLNHPPVVDEGQPLTRRERALGYLALVTFILTFVPVPISPRDDTGDEQMRYELPAERTQEGDRAEEFRL